MDFVTAFVLAKSYVFQADKQAVLEMVNLLKNALKEMLKECDWLHESTRQKAIKKINEMLSLIGYPEFIRNRQRLDEYYKRVRSYTTRHITIF